MNVQQKNLPGFVVSIRPIPEQANAFSVSYVPRGPQQARTANGGTKRAPEFTAVVNLQGDEIVVKWHKKPSYPNVQLQEFDEDVRRRTGLLLEWLGVLTQLIDSVRAWATEHEWSTKVVEKPMEDQEIGNYQAPALLLQKEVTKVLLEPIARQGHNAEGLVDLYRMPGYDDIASLYYSNHRWNLHYQVPPEPAATSMREGRSKPLTKASFFKVLEEMRRHAQ